MDKSADMYEYEQFFHVFQPICTLPGQRKFGYESLIRSRAGIRPDQLFRQYIARKQLPRLDMWSIEKAMSVFFTPMVMQKGEEQLFVNIFPSTIIDDDFPAFIQNLARQYRSFSSRVVFEISESIQEGGIWNDPLFNRRILELREDGFLIAVDDFGEGATSLKKIVEFLPDYIKLEMFFGKELATNIHKQKLVRLFVDYCGEDSTLILEGIEKEEDLQQAVSLGVPNGQGYFLGKPALTFG